jgi:hypothetical protein
MRKQEESTRETIDQLLSVTGWQVCYPQDAHITAHRGVAMAHDSGLKLIEAD